MTDIEWTDATWNPIVGCTRVSKGCVNCYAERFVHRGLAPQHRGLTVMRGGRPGWTGEVRLVADRLAEPLRWRKSKRVFVNSLSDLFHEGLAFEQIAAVFGVMAASPRHTFQVLTKRPERAAMFFRWYEGESGAGASPYAAVCTAREALANAGEKHVRDALAGATEDWPLPNVWLGVSVEDQATADERIPPLLACPAAVRWVSYEPALGPVDWKNIAPTPEEMMLPLAGLTWSVSPPSRVLREHARLDWIVVGGESGPGARPFDLAWARSTIAQCRAARVPVFVKQLGAVPHVGDAGAGWAVTYGERGRHWRMDGNATEPLTVYEIRDRKGGDPSEWPEDLRVREMPAGRTP